MTLDDLRKGRILVTGAGGFLGRHLCSLLTDGLGCDRVYQAGGYSGRPDYAGVPLAGYDLSDHGEAHALFTSRDFDYVFHVAGYNGGIQFNLDNPFDVFATNTAMAVNVLDMARRTKVKKVVSVVASCAYPENDWVYQDSIPCGDIYTQEAREVMIEDDFLDGPPHASVACHGYAKRNLQVATSYARKQYGLNAVCACPTTLYGPGDSFDPARTKVMGGMVRRFVDAVDEGLPEVSVWGSGRPLREFLYVRDAALLLVETMLKYEDADLPLNLGTGQELSVKALAETVAAAVEFRGVIRFDTSQPDGQMRKRLDLSRMAAVIGPYGPTPLADGIKATAADYRARKQKGSL